MVEYLANNPWVVVIAAMLLPFVLVRMAMPYLVAMARKKHILDSPNYRKLQRRPVAVLGGIAVVFAVVSSLLVFNLVVDLSSLFSVVCVIMVFSLLGMVDDAIDISSGKKLLMQVVCLIILVVGGDIRVENLNGFLNIYELGMVPSILLSTLLGVMLVNAINLIDGIDGLAALEGMFISLLCGVWCLRHGQMPFAIISFVYTGAMLSFFPFNVISNKYKMYMGDSGSLALGLYTCMAAGLLLSGDGSASKVNTYNLSFAFAVVSIPMVDMIRVALGRLIRGKHPYTPDRSHLHHRYVDMGFTHLGAALLILFSNGIVVLVWSAMATGISVTLQFFIVLGVSIVVDVLPIGLFTWLRKHQKQRFSRIKTRLALLRRGEERVRVALADRIDGRRQISTRRKEPVL